jgi:hypothetical protein
MDAWMASPRKVGVATAIAVAAIAAGRQARAQAPGEFPVEISATQAGSSVRVRGAGRDLPCGERCVLYLPPHDYRVIVRDVEGNESAWALNLWRPASLAVSPGNHQGKLLGIALFAGGVTATVAGVAMLYLAVRNHSDFVLGQCGDCSDVSTWRWYAGGISLGAGAVLGTAGLILWKTQGHARIAVGPQALTGSF